MTEICGFRFADEPDYRMCQYDKGHEGKHRMSIILTGDEICVVDGCTSGALGGGPMLCSGYGSSQGPCIADWLSTDPEDLEPYADFVAAR